MVGDSVHRGMFWSLVNAIQDAIASAKEDSKRSTAPPSFASHLNATVVRRFVSDKFTNFQDNDFSVTDLRDDDGLELFSIRFVYGSNAINFPQRCNLISQWFFQCLKSVEEILHALVPEEMERHQRVQQQQQRRHNRKNHLRQNPNTISPPVGVLYWNTGLWDWRTGRSPSEYEDDVLKVLESKKSGPSFQSSFVKKVVWRTVSASWPSKFMSSAECRKKPRHSSDNRPCSVHTSDIVEYNSRTRPIMTQRNFQIVDSFPITSGRPDLSYDGLHFESRVTCQQDVIGQRDITDCQKDVSQIYMHLNDALLNSICPNEVGKE